MTTMTAAAPRLTSARPRYRARRHARRVGVRPLLGPPDRIDVTKSFVAAIARELARAHGGNEVVNWLEAEELLRSCLASSR